jgi:hypothetical protein
MTQATPQAVNSSRLSTTLWIMVVAGCLIGLLAFGIRSSFGLFVDPISGMGEGAFGFGREALPLPWPFRTWPGALVSRLRGPWPISSDPGVSWPVAGLSLHRAWV